MRAFTFPRRGIPRSVARAVIAPPHMAALVGAVLVHAMPIGAVRTHMPAAAIDRLFGIDRLGRIVPVDAEHALDAADDTADRTADDGTDRAGDAPALIDAMHDAAGDALRLCRKRCRQCRE